MTTLDTQRRLQALGYYHGRIDGIAGPETVAAVRAFQRDWGIEDDGLVGLQTADALHVAADADDSPDFSETLAETIAAELEAPKPWWMSRTIVAAGAMIATGLAGVAGLDLDRATAVEVATQALPYAVALVSGVLAWWGRINATRPISRKQVAPGVRLPGDDLPPGAAGRLQRARPVPAEGAAAADRKTAADLGREAWLGD